MTTSTTSVDFTEDQYRAVYAGIAAVAANCDGAVEDDGVGFNGQDTLFGRRIASVPFEDWTADVRVEAARIAARYRKQIERSLGFDITTLPVVKEAQGLGTVTAARDTARGYERQGKKAERKARLVEGGPLVLSWSNKDPECFGTLLADVKRLPGRRWTGSVNEVDVTLAALDFIETHALAAEFDVEALRATLAPPTPTADAPAISVEEWNAQVRAKNNRIEFVANSTTRVQVLFDFDWDVLNAVKALPGRHWNGTVNTADLHPDLLVLAERHDLVVADAVKDALASTVVDTSAEQAEADLRKLVSGLANPAELPVEFVQRVLAASPKACVWPNA